MNRHVTVLVLAVLLGRCGPPPPPEYIVRVESLSASKAASGAREKAPALFKKGSDAIEAALKAHRSGDEELARDLALEASILLKTAIARAREKSATSRVESAEARVAAAEEELQRFTSLRLDTQKRFLILASYHDEQSDLAANLLSKFEADRKVLAGLEGEKRQKWLTVERERLARVLMGARGSVLAAAALGSQTLLASETEETEAAVQRADDAMDDQWEVLRPLVDDASLRADRLLTHTRAMQEPEPLANPAEDDEAVARLVQALKGTKAMVSATRRGILVSLADGLDPKTQELSPEASSALVKLADALGPDPHPLLVETWMRHGCEPAVCMGASESLEDAAVKALTDAGEAPDSITSHAWGNLPIGQEGHCLATGCPGGRLDVLVLAL